MEAAVIWVVRRVETRFVDGNLAYGVEQEQDERNEHHVEVEVGVRAETCDQTRSKDLLPSLNLKTKIYKQRKNLIN